MTHRGIAIGLLICVTCAARAEAQQPQGVIPPERVWKARSHIVRTVSGEEVSGRLVAFDANEIRMRVKGGVRAWRLDEVVEIDRTSDSLRNGAIIGALVFGVWCAYICGQGLDSTDSVSGVVLTNAGLGALIGAAIDAGTHHPVTIYRSPVATRTRQAKTILLYRWSF